MQQRALIHPYSDSVQCTAVVRCQKIEEILASKLTTLLHRRKAIDLFDLLYSIVFAKEFVVDRFQVISTFLKKSIFEPQPYVARAQLLGVPLEEYRSLWSTIVAPIRSLFSFEYAVANFAPLIDSLFGLIGRQAASPVASRLPAPLPRIAAHSIPERLSHFAWDARNILVAAGRSSTLVEFVYDGFRRLVEPYKIEYYVRKSDGVGSEYFWGYDLTGGRSRKIGMKQFFCNKIRNARTTDITFVPRYTIAL